MKRLYVRLVERLIQEARTLGYGVLRLDTLPERMGRAVVLYKRLGFVSIPPYRNNVLPGIEYMELKL